MSEQPKETLSALMDNEVSDFELRRVLEQTAETDQFADSWRRYHIARSALKHEGLNDKADISSGVMAALEHEAPIQMAQETPDKSVNSKPNSLFKPLISMAVAASVTAVVILGGQNFGVGQQPVGPAMTAQAPTKLLPALDSSKDFLRAQFGARQSPVIKQDEMEVIRLNRGLNSYIDQHEMLLQRNSVSANPGWLPDGFRSVKNAVAPGADLTVFSDGTRSFTVSVERTGAQKVPEGATQVDGMVAVGKRTENYFVTVVGDVPLLMADRVANSVKAN
jgi:negative regulator of sigma E activity